MHPSWSLEDHFSSVYWFLQASPFLFEFQSETPNVFSCSLSLLRLKSSVSSHQMASKDRCTWSLCCGFTLGASLRSTAGRVIFRGHRPLDVLIPGDKTTSWPNHLMKSIMLFIIVIIRSEQRGVHNSSSIKKLVLFLIMYIYLFNII